MEHSFTVTAGGREFKVNSMNVKTPSLFQVYVQEDGKEKRYHIKLEGAQFVFATPENCPAELLEHEEELSYAIKQQYALHGA
ncbi:MAG: hypothetical protein EOO04_02240 [Chitinophagaceae bacterium]|nr:MAG: hypothetical protein EOO04_02240 [Chitinophagaceae bacterium]